MSIVFDTEGVEMPSLDEIKINEWISKVVSSHDRKLGELAYIFCSDEKILEVNNEYLQHDYYTDIITFDYTEEDTISGDMFISLDTVKSNSEQFNTDYSEELLRVIIHGVLHLCGFADASEEEESKMRELEDKALRLIL